MTDTQLIQAARQVRAEQGDDNVIAYAPGGPLYDVDNYRSDDDFAVMTMARNTILRESGLPFCGQCGASELGFDEIGEMTDTVEAVCLDCAAHEVADIQEDVE
jgi:hypothetical protein